MSTRKTLQATLAEWLVDAKKRVKALAPYAVCETDYEATQTITGLYSAEVWTLGSLLAEIDRQWARLVECEPGSENGRIVVARDEIITLYALVANARRIDGPWSTAGLLGQAQTPEEPPNIAEDGLNLDIWGEVNL